MLTRMFSFTRNKNKTLAVCRVTFIDYTGENTEEFAFLSDGIFRFQQLMAFPGVEAVRLIDAQTNEVISCGKLRE